MKLTLIMSSAMLAIAPTASTIPMPNYASYSGEAALGPILPICAAALEAAATGQPDPVGPLVARLPREQGARLIDVCAPYMLGAMHMMRLAREAADRQRTI